MDEKIKGNTADEFAKNEVEALTSGPFIELNSETLPALCQAVRDSMPVFDAWNAHIAKVMTKERAERIKQLREVEEWTWRGVAGRTFNEWGADAIWEPATNQIAGMYLCNAAMDLLGEVWE
jgi:hypothetical protein